VLQAEEHRAVARASAAADAYTLMWRGRSKLYSADRGEFERAGQDLRAAIEREPQFALAHACLAWWHNLRRGEGRSTELSDDERHAERLSLRALELDRHDAFILSVAGHIQSFLRKRFEEAIAMFEQALQIDPNSAVAYARYATTLAYVGRAEESLERIDEAVRRSPRDPESFSFFTTQGTALFVAERYYDAISSLRKAHSLKPAYRAALRLLAASLALVGERAEASGLVQEYQELDRAAGVPPFRVSGFGQWYPMVQPHLDRLLSGLRAAGFPE
jgi:adenylate cyclase